LFETLENQGKIEFNDTLPNGLENRKSTNDDFQDIVCRIDNVELVTEP
jgi:hypothetical protein